MAILNRGRILATGAPSALKEQFGDERYRVWTRDPARAMAALSQRGSIGQRRDPEPGPDGWSIIEVEVPGGPTRVADMVQFLVGRGVTVARCERVELSLADLIERVLQMRRLLALIRADALTTFSYRLQTIVWLGGMVVTIVPLYFVAQALQPVMTNAIAGEGRQYFGFLLVGIIAVLLLTTALNALPDGIRSGIGRGTLEAMLATPTPLAGAVDGNDGLPAAPHTPAWDDHAGRRLDPGRPRPLGSWSPGPRHSASDRTGLRPLRDSERVTYSRVQDGGAVPNRGTHVVGAIGRRVLPDPGNPFLVAPRLGVPSSDVRSPGVAPHTARRRVVWRTGA